MAQDLYPLRFHPIYKEKIWGGRRLEDVLGRDLPSGRIGESWDVAAHDNGISVVQEGPLAGKTLSQLVSEYGEDLLGSAVSSTQGRFPLLLKLIDANQDLSVQVHPDDAYVRQHTDEAWGKTEMWYIIHSEPGAWIVWGLRPGVTKQEFVRAIQEGGHKLVTCLNKVSVKPGELYPISAGLVHALGAGVLVAEIQQNSDTTYRVYDWERVDDEGRPRDLHVERALEVIDFSPAGLDRGQQLSRCEQHFQLDILDQPQCLVVDLKNGFQILTALECQAQIVWNGETTLLLPGQSCLLPACLQRYELHAQGVVLKSTLPSGQLE